MRRVAGLIAGYFGIAFFGVLPWVHSTRLLDPARYPQLAALCLGMVPVLVFFAWKVRVDSPALFPANARQAGSGVSSSKIWWLALPLALLTALSMVWALNPVEGWFNFIHLSLCLAFLYVSRELLAKIPNLLDRVVKVLIVSMSLLAVVGMLQKFGYDPLHTSDKARSPVATMANPNFYGDALLMGLPFCLYVIFRLPRLGWRVAAGVAVVILVAGIVVSGARSCLMPLLLSAVLFPPVIIWRKMLAHRRWLGFLGWMAALAVMVWTSGFFFKNKEGTYNFHLIWESGHLIGPRTSSVEHRFIVWHHILNMAAERPLTGVGAGNWKLEIQRFGVKGFDEKAGYGLRVPVQPHNEYLGVLAELGFPGLILVLGIGGMGILGAYRMAFGRRGPSVNGKGDFVLGICLLMAWLCFFFDANFSFPMERPFQSMMIFWVLALSLSGGNGGVARPWMRRLGWGLCAVALVLGAATLVSRIQADAAVKALREQKDAHQAQRMLQSAKRAQNWCTQLDPASAMPIDWYVGMAHQELGQIPAALAAFERGLEIAPHQFGLRSGYASLLDLAGRPAEGVAVLRDLLEVFPDYAEGWLNLSIMQIHAGDFREAREALSQVPPGYSVEKVGLVDKTLREAGY